MEKDNETLETNPPSEDLATKVSDEVPTKTARKKREKTDIAVEEPIVVLPKVKKPRPPLTEAQREQGRANLAKGRAKRDANREARKVEFAEGIEARQALKEETMKKREANKVEKLKRIVQIDESDSESDDEIIVIKKNKVVSKTPVSVKKEVAKIEQKRPEPVRKPVILFY